MQTLHDAYRTLAWLIATPALAAWAVLSALPGLELLGLALYGPAPSAAALTGKLVLAATGIFGVFGLVLLAMALLREEARDAALRHVKGRVRVLAAYSVTWLAAYAAFEAFVA